MNEKAIEVSSSNEEDVSAGPTVVDHHAGLWRQITTLTRKCLLLLKRSWWWTLFRSFILPVAFIVFMGEAKNFFVPFAVYGVSDPSPIFELKNEVGSNLLAYYATSPNGLTDEMRRIAKRAFDGVPAAQIHELSDPDDIFKLCRQNLQGSSKCYGAIEWNSVDLDTRVYNYTVRGNSGLSYINVNSHRSATDVFVLPLQWAVDRAITNLTVTPNTQPYTEKTKDFRDNEKNRVYTNVVQNWIAPALFLGMIGVIYHLTGFVALERELGISNLLESMGVGRFARLLSAHFAFTAVYIVGWICIALALAFEVYTDSNVAIFVFFHIISGLGLVSFSLFTGSLFRSAQLAGILSSGVATILAIAVTLQTKLPGGGPDKAAAIYILSFLFPPFNYTYFLSLSARWQHANEPQNMVKVAPTSDARTIVIFVAAIVQIFLYFGLAFLTENWIHGIAKAPVTADDHEFAVRTEHLQKEYKLRSLRKSKRTTIVAVNDLNFSIRKGQIACLLGANGSGKTTTLEMISGVQKPSSGKIFLGAGSKLGLCPQKNVLWDRLTVREHVEIWAGIKGVRKSDLNSEVDRWIEGCDLTAKEATRSGRLSGGQKRKLQLAVTFVGDSNICCIDEVSSGLDPLSRRKIWDIILAQQGRVSIILTTHFLDEADLLADKIAVMSRGNLRAEGSTVDLKDTMGGYRIYVSHHGTGQEEVIELATSSEVLDCILRLEQEGKEYKIASPELEDVFLKIAMADHDGEDFTAKSEPIGDLGSELTAKAQTVGILGQTAAMLRKRLTIFRRNPFPEIVTFAIPVVVAAATRSFVASFAGQSCDPTSQFDTQQFNSFDANDIQILMGPQSQVEQATGGLSSFVQQFITAGNVTTSEAVALFVNQGIFVDTFAKFENYISANFSTLDPGGMFLDPPTVAYRIDSGSFGTFQAPLILNLLNNIRMNGTVTLVTNFSPFQNPWTSSTGDTLQFVVYFGLAMSVAPAFIGLYPTYERLSKVRAMHYSNGLRIAPLWTAYTLFNFVFSVLCSAVLVGIIASASPNVIGVGYLFLCFLLYGLTSILLAYVFSMFVQSQLAAFAVSAAAQACYFLLYLIAYLCVLTYGKPATIPSNLLAVHFTMALVMPVANLVRALFVCMNLFGVLCKQDGGEITYLGNIVAYGGPILYFILQAIVLYGFIIWWESGRRIRIASWFKRRKHTEDTETNITNTPKEVLEEISVVEEHPELYDSGLKLTHVTKSYDGHTYAVDDVTFGVQENETFALLGPNGAGKTTTFNMLRGEDAITSGAISVNSISVSENRTLARTRLGVCPQFDAMDKMQVVEILRFYGRLRGLTNVQYHVDQIVEAVGLNRFRTRMAHKLSGGNKRKLSLAIALIGNPPVLLLDEPSSGMDAFAKRIMWRTLAHVTQGRSIVLTTHSMEEADALASRAAILSKRLLTIGTTEYLRDAYGHAYHVHIICNDAPHTTRSEMDRVIAWTQERLPGAVVGDRVYQGQIKMTVPAASEKLSDVFKLMELEKQRGGIERFAISTTTLEEVFLKIVGAHQVEEHE